MWRKWIYPTEKNSESEVHCVFFYFIFFQHEMGQRGENVVDQRVQPFLVIGEEKVLTLQTQWPLLDLLDEVCSTPVCVL